MRSPTFIRSSMTTPRRPFRTLRTPLPRPATRLGSELYIEALPDTEEDFDVWLSRAYFAAVRKQPDLAAAALTRAFNVRPHSDALPLLTEYQYAQACEIVGKETGDARFTRMLLDWARKHQKVQPAYAWAYAVEAQYSTIAG